MDAKGIKAWSRKEWLAACRKNPLLLEKLKLLKSKRKLSQIGDISEPVVLNAALLPRDILLKIFDELDNKSWLVCRLVCRNWNSCIESCAKYWSVAKFGCNKVIKGSQLERALRVYARRAKSSFSELQLHKNVILQTKSMLDGLLISKSGLSCSKLVICTIAIRNWDNYRYWLMLVRNITRLDLVNVDLNGSMAAFLTPLLYCDCIKEYRVVSSEHCRPRKNYRKYNALSIGTNLDHMLKALQGKESQLESLHIDGILGSCRGFVNVLGSIAPRLKHFYVTRQTEIELNWLQFLRRLPLVETLHLGFAFCYDFNIEDFVGLTLVHLQHFYVRASNFVTAQSMRLLAQCAPNLKTLLIPGCVHISPLESGVVPWYKLTPNMRHLDLSECCSIAPEILVDILSSLPNLEALYLANHPMLFVHALTLSQEPFVKHMKHLQCLYIDNADSFLRASYLVGLLRQRTGDLIKVLSVQNMPHFSNEAVDALRLLVDPAKGRVYANLTAEYRYEPDYDFILGKELENLNYI